MNSIGIFDNFINFFDSFMIFYENNHKTNLVTLDHNFCEVHILKFIFMNFIDLVMTDYDHCYELM